MSGPDPVPGYTPSPRPTFDRPTVIPYSSVTRHLWGDPVAGSVADWVYVSSDHLHQLVWGVPVGGGFTHSEASRTVFGADVVYVVLEGAMVIANPETGETHRVAAGEAAFFRKDTWHHAWNDSEEPLRALEFMAPPPSQGTTGPYARTRPYLERPTYRRADLTGRWPTAHGEVPLARTIWPLREADLLWTVEGDAHPLPVALAVSTEHLTAGRVRLRPGQRGDRRQHAGDTGVYVVAGTLNVEILDGSRPNWLEIGPRDGAFLPGGTPHALHNVGGEPVEAWLGTAPPDPSPGS